MKNWKVWVGIGISGLFLYIAFDNVDWKNLWNAMLEVNYAQLFLAMVIVALMFFIRAHRWSFFLKPIKNIRMIPLFWSATIGFAVNNILPARLGEVARAYSLHKKEEISFGASFGSIVVERLYDTFSILFLFIFCLFIFDFPSLSGLFGRSETEIAIMLGGIACVLLSGVLLLRFRTEFVLRLTGFFLTPLKKEWREKFISFLRNFISGLTQTKNPIEAAWILILSFGLWVISAFTVWLAVEACNVEINLSQTMVVLMSLVVAVSIPAAPGYAGTYHYLASTALMIAVNIPKEQALTIATLIHAANYIPQTTLGLAALMYEGIRFSDVKKIKEQLEGGRKIE